MAETVNGLASKVVCTEVKLESAPEMINVGGELVSVEMGYCAGGLLEIIS